MQDFDTLLTYILVFAISASAGFFLVSRSKKLFLFIRPEILRRNLVTFLIGFCFFFALGHLIPDFRNIMENYGWGTGMALSCVIVISNVLLPYNIVLYITEGRRFAQMDFMKQQVLIFLSIVITSVIVNGFLNYAINDTTRFLKYSIVWSIYMAGFGSLIYLFIRQNDLERAKKLSEKELELARLNEQKSKAELDALHARINPHFLYNALNSIADLAVTDGQKARKMTISLADLFRASINYTGSNYSTVAEEIGTAKLYLEIEKIRFEDQLNYTISSADESLSRQVPKFILQPIIENAVKHGLKRTRQQTEVNIEIGNEDEYTVIRVYDNGPPFPSELIPGYGLKSIYDKLELLYPSKFEISMVNEPKKYFQVRLNNQR